MTDALMARDGDHVLTFAALQELVNRAWVDAHLGRGPAEVTLTLPVVAWVGILDELKERRPRNLSYLLANDTAERLDAAIDRMHDEVNFVIASGTYAFAATDRQRKR